MAKLNFDFHPPRTRPGLVGVALLLTGIAAAAASFADMQRAEADKTALLDQIATQQQAQQKRTPVRSAAKRNTARNEEAQMARARVTASLDYSWQPTFAALEATRSKKIALLSLDANQAKKQVRLVAEARRLSDAVEYVGQLGRQSGVKRAVLQQHEVQNEPEERPVRFTLLLEMRS